MKTPEGIVVSPVGYQEIVALLQSDELAAVESSVAQQCRLTVLRELRTSTTSAMQ